MWVRHTRMSSAHPPAAGPVAVAARSPPGREPSPTGAFTLQQRHVLDIPLIQPLGCTSSNRCANRLRRLRPHVRRARRSHAARHRPPRDQRRGGHRRAGQPLPNELRGGPEAHRHPRTRRPGCKGARRTPQGRAHQSRAAARRAPPARRVRGAVAWPHRPHGRPHCRHQGAWPVTVTAVHKDPHRLTMTIEAEFDASPERVWQLWADPSQLERWWGPPNYPATVKEHNLAPGGRVEYGMIGPQGDRHRGYWEILEVEAPRRLVLRDGLNQASADGTPYTDMAL